MASESRRKTTTYCVIEPKWDYLKISIIFQKLEVHEEDKKAVQYQEQQQ